MISTLLPILIILILLFIAVVVACCLYKRSRAAKAEGGLDDSGNAFVSKGAPVIFPDEVEADEKDALASTPMLVKEERAPLPLPHIHDTPLSQGLSPFYHPSFLPFPSSFSRLTLMVRLIQSASTRTLGGQVALFGLQPTLLLSCFLWGESSFCVPSTYRFAWAILVSIHGSKKEAGCRRGERGDVGTSPSERRLRPLHGARESPLPPAAPAHPARAAQPPAPQGPPAPPPGAPALYPPLIPPLHPDPLAQRWTCGRESLAIPPS